MKFGIFTSVIVLVAAPLTDASASPPPPPPQYVTEVAKLLTDNAREASATPLARYIANDVRLYVNSKLIADGKANWMRQEAKAKQNGGGMLAYSEGWKQGGSLLIVDQYDTVDRSSLPPGILADPRYAVRSTLYQFGNDGKIHSIHTLTADGFWMQP